MQQIELFHLRLNADYLIVVSMQADQPASLCNAILQERPLGIIMIDYRGSGAILQKQV